MPARAISLSFWTYAFRLGSPAPSTEGLALHLSVATCSLFIKRADRPKGPVSLINQGFVKQCTLQDGQRGHRKVTCALALPTVAVSTLAAALCEGSKKRCSSPDSTPGTGASNY